MWRRVVLQLLPNISEETDTLYTVAIFSEVVVTRCQSAVFQLSHLRENSEYWNIKHGFSKCLYILK